MGTATKMIPESPMQYYFHDLAKHRLIDPKREKTLALKYHRDKDPEALQELINSNLRLVVKIAKDFASGRDTSLPDLIQEGNVGLVRAAQKFDPSKKVKFSYYASFWIKAHIYKHLIDNTRSVRLGTTQSQRKLFFNLNKTKAALRRQGLRGTPDEIARQLDVKATVVIEMEKRLDAPDVSLNDPIPGRKATERGEQMAADTISVEDEVAERELMGFLRENVRRFKKRLKPREATILDRRILSPDPLTLRDLGERHGVSRERIRQIESRIIKRFKEYLLSVYPDVDRQALRPAG